MLRNKLFNYSLYINYLFKDKCIIFKSIQNSSKILFGNICRIRYIEIERYLSQNFKYKFNEKKSKFTNSFGRILLGATVLSFAGDKITDEEVQEHFDEFCSGQPNLNPSTAKENHSLNQSDIVRISSKKLSLGTSFSKINLKLDNKTETPKMPTTSFSNSSIRKLSTENPEGFVDSSWVQLINSKTVKLWRRPLKSNPKVFEYRLCGTFDNISAKSFFVVQTDVDYRKQWDDLIVDLQILSTNRETETHTIRWVTHYPYPMNDREYIYKRRSCLSEENNTAIIVSKAIDEVALPTKKSSSAVRIVDYKSIMYIQSHTSFDKVGMDYFLIYYDDPKTNFPSAAVSWMSTAGIPSFMEKVHKASLVLEQRLMSENEESSDDDENLCRVENDQKSYENDLGINFNNEPFYSHFTTAFASMDNHFFRARNSEFPSAQKSQ